MTCAREYFSSFKHSSLEGKDSEIVQAVTPLILGTVLIALSALISDKNCPEAIRQRGFFREVFEIATIDGVEHFQFKNMESKQWTWFFRNFRPSLLLCDQMRDQIKDWMKYFSHKVL